MYGSCSLMGFHSRLPLNPRLLVGLIEHGLGYILGPDLSLFRDSVFLLGLLGLHISIGDCGRSAGKIQDRARKRESQGVCYDFPTRSARIKITNDTPPRIMPKDLSTFVVIGEKILKIPANK